MKHRLVIARWNEDVFWAHAYPHFIYDKGGAPMQDAGFDVIHLTENPEGHESHTYLYHIITRYNQLDDYTAFVQGYPFDHANEFDTQWKAEVDFGWIGHWMVQDDRKGRPHHFNDIPVGEAYRAIFDREPPEMFRFIAGAQFVASKERIQSHPITFYEHIQALGYKPEFMKEWGYTMERLWWYIMGDHE